MTQHNSIAPRRYLPHNITNRGESMVDRLFDQVIHYDNDEWYIIHSLLLDKHISQKEGECDFVLINKRGIMVLEVKGGQIAYENGSFVQRKSRHNLHSRTIHPFDQAEDNATTLQRIFGEKGKRHLLTCCAVVFPESDIKITSTGHQNYWSLSTEGSFRDFLVYQLEYARHRIIESIKNKKPKDQHHEIDKWFPAMSNEELAEVLEMIEPRAKSGELSTQMKLNKQEAGRRAADNMRMLSGLSENKRLLIQGPPGSGKSKYARKFIEEKIAENEKGLYICWNELLAASMQQQFADLGFADKVQSVPLFGLIRQMVEESGTNKGVFSYTDLEKSWEILEAALGHLLKEHKLPEYDFLVFDEAQDMFDMGIELLIEFLLAGGENGTLYGDYIVFYDGMQAFNSGINRQRYENTLSLLKHHAAIYHLFDSYRAIAGHGISEFINSLVQGSFNAEVDYGDDVVILQFNDFDRLSALIRQTIREIKDTTDISSEEIVLLFTSNLLSGNEHLEKPMDNRLPEGEFLKLTNENLMVADPRIKFTTALKFKGLEREVAIVVADDLQNQKIDTMYQLFIGCSRAKSRLYVIVPIANYS
ncbi:MAG: NERD domain-containing protein [Bacteroidetes bacterium]|nr:NERD domain-containing protein [Bacteroidota bacterium]MBU1718491.1 NERD domain-containing protein [Bacteroidota bacterium]